MTESDELLDRQIDDVVDLALAEDAVENDTTTRALIPSTLLGQAAIRAEEDGILAGVEVARAVFRKVDASLEFTGLIHDGTALRPGDVIAGVFGRVSSILRAERVVLNFLQRLSGIATLASRYASQMEGTSATVIDTRKTTPGLRLLEKYAVRMGGAGNHRFSLSDGILVKDNHLAAVRALEMTLGDVVTTTRKNAPAGMKVEVEVTSVDEAVKAAEAGADIILLDNMSPAEMRRAVGLLPKGVRTEASGGITLANVREAAEAGVDFISVGALTHSPPALDISLDLDESSVELP
jgi:nicotinate-nucleotide pyrophosphorylase (carboxylating)